MIPSIFALLITITVEFLIFSLLFRNSFLKLLIYAVIINSITLPVATYIYIYILNNLLIVEIGVILVESVLIMLILDITYKKAFFVSLAANTVTALIGLSGLVNLI